MKAKDLIEILSEHPEREVKFFNGLVDDWMDIEVYDEILVKEKPSYTLEKINAQNSKYGWPLIDKKEVLRLKKAWEISYYELDNYSKKEFSSKEVFMISGKRRNKITYDGGIEY